MTRAIRRPGDVYMSRKQTREYRSRTNQAKACIAAAITVGSLPTVIFVSDGFRMTPLLWSFLVLVVTLLRMAYFYLKSAGRVAGRALDRHEE